MEKKYKKVSQYDYRKWKQLSEQVSEAEDFLDEHRNDTRVDYLDRIVKKELNILSVILKKKYGVKLVRIMRNRVIFENDN